MTRIFLNKINKFTLKSILAVLLKRLYYLTNSTKETLYENLQKYNIKESSLFDKEYFLQQLRMMPLQPRL